MSLALAVSAQNNQGSYDVIYLKSGAQIVGQIVRYNQDEKVIIRQTNGEVVEIAVGKIKKIVQGTTISGTVVEAPAGPVKTPPPTERKKQATARTKGIYNSTMLSLALGSSDRNNLLFGAGLSNVTGYQQKAFGIGIGVGIDNYARQGETLYPVFAEIRYIIPSQKVAKNYYVTAAGGYGFAFKREKVGVIEADGGLMTHLALGYKTVTSDGMDVLVDVGLKFQDARFKRQLFGGDVEQRDIRYQRFVLRVGLSLWK